jgi:plasmid stabilization system protein ParE
MTARYRVIVMSGARADDSAIQRWIAENQGYERADKWEEGLALFLRTLTINPRHEVVRPATLKFPEPVRSIIYRSTKKGAGYILYFTVEEAERPDPEPEEDYFAGIVRIIAIEHASSQSMSEEEIDARRNLR